MNVLDDCGARLRGSGGGGVSFGGRARSMLDIGESSNVAGTLGPRAIIGGAVVVRARRIVFGVGVRPTTGVAGVGVRPTTGVAVVVRAIVGVTFGVGVRPIAGVAFNGVGGRVCDGVRESTECG